MITESTDIRNAKQAEKLRPLKELSYRPSRIRPGLIRLQGVGCLIERLADVLFPKDGIFLGGLRERKDGKNKKMGMNAIRRENQREERGIHRRTRSTFLFSLTRSSPNPQKRELETDNNPNGFTHQQLENHFFNNEVATTLNQLLIRGGILFALAPDYLAWITATSLPIRFFSSGYSIGLFSDNRYSEMLTSKPNGYLKQLILKWRHSCVRSPYCTKENWFRRNASYMLKKGVKRADPKGKKIALGGRSKNSEVNVLSDGKPKTPRTFTPLGITLSRTLERLQKHGVLTPLPPSPSPDPLPPRYKAHAYCKYL
ncbi:hypothetical protein VNO77_46311 [Canavalia gladiata]|uniref:Uncharacterized protein n=1 Tax=Canavalia gladiata TaxID=3824 RepID=A0AAN9JIK1_CANGL